MRAWASDSREAGKEDGELLAAVAGEQTGGSELLGPAGHSLTQQSVTRLMAMGVVVGLEVVHVHHRDAQGGASLEARRTRPRQLVVPGPTVGCSRQGVRSGESGQLHRLDLDRGQDLRHPHEHQQRDEQRSHADDMPEHPTPGCTVDQQRRGRQHDPAGKHGHPASLGAGVLPFGRQLGKGRHRRQARCGRDRQVAAQPQHVGPRAHQRAGGDHVRVPDDVSGRRQPQRRDQQAVRRRLRSWGGPHPDDHGDQQHVADRVARTDDLREVGHVRVTRQRGDHEDRGHHRSPGGDDQGVQQSGHVAAGSPGANHHQSPSRQHDIACEIERVRGHRIDLVVPHVLLDGGHQVGHHPAAEAAEHQQPAPTSQWTVVEHSQQRDEHAAGRDRLVVRGQRVSRQRHHRVQRSRYRQQAQESE